MTKIFHTGIAEIDRTWGSVTLPFIWAHLSFRGHGGESSIRSIAEAAKRNGIHTVIAETELQEFLPGPDLLIVPFSLLSSGKKSTSWENIENGLQQVQRLSWSYQLGVLVPLEIPHTHLKQAQLLNEVLSEFAPIPQVIQIADIVTSTWRDQADLVWRCHKSKDARLFDAFRLPYE